MTDLLAMRQTLNANLGEEGVKACAFTFEKFPEVNYKEVSFDEKTQTCNFFCKLPSGAEDCAVISITGECKWLLRLL
jgi:hypothetical protein